MTTWFAITFIVCMIVLGILYWVAPEGYEDETGFHLGSQPEADDTPQKMKDAA